MPNFRQLPVLDRLTSRAFLFRHSIEQLFAIETDADPARTIRKYPPVVICFGSLSKTKCQNRLKSILFSVEIKKMRIVFVIPGLWVEECNSLLTQQVDKRRNISIAPKVFS
jgi:hypothetical protein